MRRFLVTPVLIAACLPAFSQVSDATVLKKLNSDWIATYATKDTAALGKILADDLVLINPKGIKMTKKDILDGLPNQSIATAAVDSSDVRLLTPTVAVVTAYMTFTMSVDGKTVMGKNCYQDIYMKRKTRWQAVSAHVTLLSMK